MDDRIEDKGSSLTIEPVEIPENIRTRGLVALQAEYGVPFVDKMFNEGTADKARCTGNEYIHERDSPWCEEVWLTGRCSFLAARLPSNTCRNAR